MATTENTLLAVAVTGVVVIVAAVAIGVAASQSEQTPAAAWTKTQADGAAEVRRMQQAADQAAQAAQAAAVAATPAYTNRDLSALVNASQNNEVRFRRDYKGRTYGATVTFESLGKEIFSGYSVTFTDGSSCRSITDQAQLDRMADWPRGRSVRIIGTISDTVLGNLMLDDCRFDVPLPAPYVSNYTMAPAATPAYTPVYMSAPASTPAEPVRPAMAPQAAADAATIEANVARMTPAETDAAIIASRAPTPLAPTAAPSCEAILAAGKSESGGRPVYQMLQRDYDLWARHGAAHWNWSECSGTKLSTIGLWAGNR